MTTKTFPGEYAHGTITLGTKFYAHDGSAAVYQTISDVSSLLAASFNGRTGAITLTTSDITTAGGVAAANPQISGTLTNPSAGAARVVGAPASASTLTEKFLTSGFSNSHDVQVQYSGGTNGVVGQGTINFTCGAFQINGVPISANSNPTPRIVTASGPVQVLATDGLIVLNKAADEATTVTLEASPAANRVPIRIVDGKGNAGTFNITVVPASGTIDGISSAVINYDRGALTIEAAGGNHFIT